MALVQNVGHRNVDEDTYIVVSVHPLVTQIGVIVSGVGAILMDDSAATTEATFGAPEPPPLIFGPFERGGVEHTAVVIPYVAAAGGDVALDGQDGRADHRVYHCVGA